VVLLSVSRPVGRGCVGCVRTSQISKMQNKNTDTVHNAPCVEERSTFYKKTPPISFPAYVPGLYVCCTHISARPHFAKFSIHVACGRGSDALVALLHVIFFQFCRFYSRLRIGRGTVVERRSLTGELSLSCARPAADG